MSSGGELVLFKHLQLCYEFVNLLVAGVGFGEVADFVQRPLQMEWRNSMNYQCTGWPPGTDKTAMNFQRLLPEIRWQSCLSPVLQLPSTMKWCYTVFLGLTSPKIERNLPVQEIFSCSRDLYWHSPS